MDRFTRKELKSDQFSIGVEHSVDYVSQHRKQFIQWGSIALGILIVFLAVSWYRNYQHAEREKAMGAAFDIQNANIGPSMNEYQKSFPSQAEKDKAVGKVFSEIAAKYPGTDEGYIAEFYLGALAGDHGDLAQAEKRFRLVDESGPKAYASLAKLSLAQIYQAQGKIAEAQKLVHSVIENPTVLVSKEAATIALARLVAPTNPQEARKLLEPLRASQRSQVSRAALTALSDLPAK